ALERARLARPERVRTNRELAAELPKRGAGPEMSKRVQALVRDFDLTYYSLDPVATESACAFLLQVEQIDRELGEATR
ncbi:MAG: DUF4129 domain-containing protein, partial [Myxococcaceae bacterium]